MRKHKSVVAILLAVMMIFTFMPTMAFAADEYSGDWNEDGTVYTVTYGTQTKEYKSVNRVWSATYGYVESQLDSTGIDPGTFDEFDSYAYAHAGTYTYYDLNNAFISDKAKNGYTTISYEYFMTPATAGTLVYNEDTGVYQGRQYVFMKEPAYCKGYDEKNPKDAVQLTTDAFKQTITAEGFTVGSYDDMSVTLKANVVPSGQGAGTSQVKFIGAVPSATVTVQGKKANVNQFEFAIDNVKKPVGVVFEREGAYYGYASYDSESHKIVNSEVKGFTVDYEMQDPDTKLWKAGDIEFKNVGTYYGRVRAHKVGEKASGDYTYVTVVVAAARGFGFDFDHSIYRHGPGARVELPEGTDPLDYVTIQYSRIAGFDQEKHVFIYETVDMTGADKEEAMKYFADAYDVTATPEKADPSRVTWKIALKKDADMTALEKTYKTLFANYYDDNTNAPVTADVLIVAKANTEEDDISFEGQTKFVYSGKQTTKKGVLKKKQTITVNATADSGNAITYVATKKADGKITVSTSGKITVKKGLKKGTYTVTVKAKTKAGNGYKAAKEKQTYTIVVKK